MAHRRSPSQRPRKLSVAIPTRDGEIKIVSEDLPTSKVELERAILDKFIRALATHTGRKWTDAKRDNLFEWPDFEVTEHDATVGVEITEILPKAAVELDIDRNQYTELILNGFRERQIDARLPAITVQISDLAVGERYPKPQSKAGRSIIKQIVDEVENHVGKIVTLPVGQPLSWSIHLIETSHIATLNAFRRSHNTVGEPFAFKVGYGTTVLARTVNERLLNTIREKIRYSKFDRGKLALLVFTFEITDLRPQAIARAVAALRETGHPYHEIWLVRPKMDVIRNPGYDDYYPVSDIVRVWPSASEAKHDEAEPSENELVFTMKPEEGVIIRPPHRSAPLRSVAFPVTPDIDILPTSVAVNFGHYEVRISFDMDSLPDGVHPTASDDPFDPRKEALRHAINGLRQAIASAYFPGWKLPNTD